MELDGRISNKLLVGGIFAVLIFGLVGSQQAMGGGLQSNDISIKKCVAFTESEAGNRECRVSEGSARTVLTLEEGDTGFFRIDADNITPQEGGASSVLVKDNLPNGLRFVSSSTSGNSYNPSTGVWSVGSLGGGTTSRFLIIGFEVLPGTCGSDLVNTASLDPANQDGGISSNDSDSATVKVRGAVIPNGEIEVREPCPSRGGGGDHEAPTIGKNRAGIQIVPSNGICIDPLKNPEQCWTVTEFDTGFELLPLLSSSHTITNTIFCNEGVQECNYVGVSFMTSTDLFGELVMMVEAQKKDGEWIISWYDPQDFIQDPDDDPRGEITFTAQIEGDFLLTSFTINFKNKDTGELVIRIQVGDEERGIGTFWFNEGVEFKDTDAYPSIETEYKKSLEIAPLCLNEDPDYRYSCAFAEKVQLEIERAEKLLAE